MILLTEVSGVEEFYRIKTLFESKGIAAYYGNQDSARNFGVFHPAGKYSIHLLINEQFEDAQQLLLDPNHTVQHPVELSEFNEQKNSRVVNKKIINTLLLILFTIVVSVFLIFLVIK